MGIIESYIALTGLGCMAFALLGSREGRGQQRPPGLRRAA